MDEPLRIIEITSISDDLFPAWLDLYEMSFPANERVLVSTFFRIFKAMAAGKAEHHHFLAVVDARQAFDLARSIFGNAVEEIGELALV